MISSENFAALLDPPVHSVIRFLIDDVFYLQGGNVLQHFATTLRDWITELGCETVPDISHILQTFEESAKIFNNSQMQNNDVIISPTIYGERYSPNQFAIISNLNSRNTSLGSVTKALFKGLVNNLYYLFSKELLDSCNVSRIVVTGGAVINNELLQKLIEEVFELPLRICDQNDAASGAIFFKRK